MTQPVDQAVFRVQADRPVGAFAPRYPAEAQLRALVRMTPITHLQNWILRDCNGTEGPPWSPYRAGGMRES